MATDQQAVADNSFKSSSSLFALFMATITFVMTVYFFGTAFTNAWFAGSILFAVVFVFIWWLTETDVTLTSTTVSYQTRFNNAVISLADIEKVGFSAAFRGPVPQQTIIFIMKAGQKTQGHFFRVGYFARGSARRWVRTVNEALSLRATG